MILLQIIHTIVSRLLLVIIMVILCVPTIIFLLLPEKVRYHNKICNYLQYTFYWLLVKAMLVPIRISGKENIPSTPAVLVANHQSSLDIPIVGSLVGAVPHIWLATNELMRSPIWRFILPKTTVLVDVSSPVRGMRTLLSAINRVYKEKLYSIVFPEGGRFSDGQIHDFFGGFAILAKKTGQPVVPIYIQNLHKIYPKGVFLLQWHPIVVIIGKPIRPHEDESSDAFCHRVYQWFCDQTEGGKESWNSF